MSDLDFAASADLQMGGEQETLPSSRTKSEPTAVKSESKAGPGGRLECIHVKPGATPPHFFKGVIRTDDHPLCVYVGVLNKLEPAFEGRKRVFALDHLTRPRAVLLLSPWRCHRHRLPPASPVAPGHVRRRRCHCREGSEPGARL